jgi:hypothetical protein
MPASQASVQSRKRARPALDDNDVGSAPIAPQGNGVQDALDQSTLNELDILRSHTSRFHVRTHPVPVYEVYQWYYTDTAKQSQLKVPENYYQRDMTKYQREMTKGWTDDQTAEYLRTVFAGQAATPFVINVKRKDARVVDGGHRLNALLKFKKDEIGMRVGSKLVKFSELPQADQDHFNNQDLQILEFKDIPIKEEIGVYIKHNSGLAFSLGEKLAAMEPVNDMVKVASRVISGMQASPSLSFDTLSRILKKEDAGKDGGRKNELVVATFLVYNLHFRKALSGSPHLPAPGCFANLGDRFVEAIDRLSGCDAVAVPDNQVDAVCADVVSKVERAAALYAHVTGEDAAGARTRTGQTPFRRLVVCIMAVVDVPDLSPDRFKQLLESPAPPVRSLLARPVELRAPVIRRIVAAYGALPAPPPAPGPAGTAGRGAAAGAGGAAGPSGA